MKRNKLVVLATSIFSVVYLSNLSIVASTSSQVPNEGQQGPPASQVDDEAAQKKKSEGGHGAATAEEPAIDPSKFEFYPNVQSVNDLEEVEEMLPETEVDGDTNVKVVYRTPDTCKEFSIYMQEKQKKLIALEEKIRQKQLVLEQLKSEFETVTTKFSTVEERIKKLMQRDPTNLKDNPELANMIKLYETFSAEEAAERLKNLDLDLTLALLKGMKPKKLSQIMTAMEPRMAAALSSQMVRGF